VPKAVEDCRELLLWVIPHLDKLPRNRRFTLGDRLETRLLTILEMLVTAAYSQNKRQFLIQANRDLEVCRHLWESILSFDNLLLAYRKARKGKRSRYEVAEFSLNLEPELMAIQTDLQMKTYQPGAYRLFTLYERKPRQIAAAPFRDRIVHHALLNIVEPLLDKQFIADNYACRQGKGVHLAVDRYQQWSKRSAYALKLDIARYFPNIDHIILKQQLTRRLKDSSVLWLFDTIIDHSPLYPLETVVNLPGETIIPTRQRRVGIPIGNLTSQFLANLYLDGFDHFIKQELRVPAYLRYVDDLFLLSDSKCQLHQWKAAIAAKLVELQLTVHPAKANILQTRQGVDVLGYRVYPTFRRL
jgi:RNA-directed DNA polymerase